MQALLTLRAVMATTKTPLVIGFVFLLGGVAGAPQVLAQAPTSAPVFPFRGDEIYGGKVQAPWEFLGAPLGSRFTSHYDVLRYCRYLAENSERADLVEYGLSSEGRTLFYLVISMESHVARADDIRDLQMRLADPRLVGGEREAVLGEMLPRLPAIVWLSYNVHGNEASGTEAALMTAYQLVDGEDAATRRLRERVFVILDPLLNPDGRERYRNWYHSTAIPGGDPDPQAREHAEPWPGGRTNHYYFDLNRDWSWLSQPETRARAPHYLRWQPLVHVDLHEMSPESSYFFFPADDPINVNFTRHTTEWSKTFGLGNAAAFDQYGWRYYTGELFDFFYPGYGDTWPALHGSIGMTYEQAGGPSGGLRYRRRDGVELTLRERTHHHYVASMATLTTAADNKDALQRSFFEFRRSALEDRVEGEVIEFLLPPGQGQRLDGLINLLIDQGIEVERTQDEGVAEAVADYLGAKHELVKLPVGSYIVSTAQPAGRLVRALLEPEAKVTVNKFYDISAWSLPLSMGVDAYMSTRRVEVARRAAGRVLPPVGKVDGVGNYGYLLAWDGASAAKALQQLLQQKLHVRLVPERVRSGAEVFERGSVYVAAHQADGIDTHAIVAATARDCGVRFVGIASGFTDEGIDLGSDKVERLAAPRIAVVCGERVSSSSFGAIWFLFERELGIPFTAVNFDRLGRIDLDSYNVLILPETGALKDALGENGLQRLKRWVEGGGVLVALGSAALALSKEQTGFTSVSSLATKPEKEEPEKPERRKLKELEERERERQVPGGIFRVDLDVDHPLTLGVSQFVYAFMDTTDSFAVSGDGREVGAFTEEPALSGYISKENIAKLSRRVYLAEENLGRGHVVLFAGDPNFRMFWRGLTRLFLNAVFLRCAD
ncbi:MAG: M14 family metallopeptidase [Planctomycetota bacterium]